MPGDGGVTPTPDGGTDGGTDGPVTPDPDSGVEPGTAVTGTAKVKRLLADGTSTETAQDLSGYTIQALVEDFAQPSGFRVLGGTGRADGTFTIADVPQGTYYLKLIEPGATTPRYYVTDARILDLGTVEYGRATAPVTRPTPVTLALTGMHGWRSGDDITAHSFSAGAEDYLSADRNATQLPADGDTSAGAVFDWRTGWSYGGSGGPMTIDAAHDDLWLTHLHRQELHNAGGNYELTTIADAIKRDTTISDGHAVTIAGQFLPVAPTATEQVQVDVGSYQAGLGSVTGVTYEELIVSRITNPAASAGIGFGPSLYDVTVDLDRGAASGNHTYSIAYGSPFPAAWPEVNVASYRRVRHIKAPGATSSTPISYGALSFRAAADAPRFALDLAPVTAVRMNGDPSTDGGAVAFDGTAPLTVSWTPATGADFYTVSAQRLTVEAGRTRRRTVASFVTAAASVSIPASALTIGELYIFAITATKDASGFRTGVLRRTGLPFSTATTFTGIYRLSATCGDRVTSSTEECDDAGASATCDADCTSAICGDGVVNPAAGEACDPVIDSLDCDADCTPVVCGDGYSNFAVEECDDGNHDDDGNGCSAQCTRIGRCGDGTVQTWFEGCDDGNTRPGDGCDADCQVEAPQP